MDIGKPSEISRRVVPLERVDELGIFPIGRQDLFKHISNSSFLGFAPVRRSRAHPVPERWGGAKRTSFRGAAPVRRSLAHIMPGRLRGAKPWLKAFFSRQGPDADNADTVSGLSVPIPAMRSGRGGAEPIQQGKRLGRDEASVRAGFCRYQFGGRRARGSSQSAMARWGELRYRVPIR